MKLMFRMHVHEHGGVKSKDYEREGSTKVRIINERRVNKSKHHKQEGQQK